mgnify:CR=1 FL=1
MKNFWIRIVNVAAILVIIFGYNMVTEAREKDDEIAKLSAQIQSEVEIQRVPTKTEVMRERPQDLAEILP